VPHGAAPTTALTHIAIQEQLDGKAGFLFLAKTSQLFVTPFCLGKGYGLAGKSQRQAISGLKKRLVSFWPRL
jgi:hypothetical protein